MSTIWRLEARGPMPIIRAAGDTLNALPEPPALGWSLFEDGSPEAGRIDVLFAEQPDAGAFAEMAGLVGEEVGVTFGPLPDEDWIAMSLEGLPSVEAGRFLVFGAHAAADLQPGQIGLEIEAGPAFGTGHHGTTKGCLDAADALEQAGFHPASVLDLGTGTGLLAVAAAKLWPECEILATDIDEQSVVETVENADKNGVKHRIEALVADGFHHSMLDGAQYDLVFANILAGPLVDLAPGITERLAPNGRVILSGLLEDQSPKVEDAYAGQGLTLTGKTILDGWATLVYRR